MDIELARTNMLTQQIRTWGVLDQTILDVVANTPREFFVPEVYKDVAFADMTIPLPHGQIMFLPKEEARIIQALKIQTNDRILEIGTGSGYMTALLASLGKYVDSIDIFPNFTEQAQKKLIELNIHNVNLITANAAHGWESSTHYDVIIITGSLPFLPVNFRKILKSRGRLFIIVGQAPAMEATLMTHGENGHWSEEKLFETVVPRLLDAAEPSLFLF